MILRAGNGRIDVSPETIGLNISADTLFSMPESAGAITDPLRPPGLMAAPDVYRPLSNRTTTYWGNWYKVNDESIKIHRVFAGPIEVSSRIMWDLGNGSQLMLHSDEARYDISMWQWPYRNPIDVSNAYVKATSHTLNALRSLGLIPPGAVVPNDPTPPSTGDVIQTSARALVVLALIGAAIYFLPKDILR